MTAFIEPARQTILFFVEDMVGAGAAASIRTAVNQLDSGATLRVDLPLRRVEIEPTRGEPSQFRDVIRDAGFSVTREWPPESLYI